MQLNDDTAPTPIRALHGNTAVGPAQVERAKQRALEMLIDDAGEGIRRVEDILSMETI